MRGLEPEHPPVVVAAGNPQVRAHFADDAADGEERRVPEEQLLGRPHPLGALDAQGVEALADPEPAYHLGHHLADAGALDEVGVAEVVPDQRDGAEERLARERVRSAGVDAGGERRVDPRERHGQVESLDDRVVPEERELPQGTGPELRDGPGVGPRLLEPAAQLEGVHGEDRLGRDQRGQAAEHGASLGPAVSRPPRAAARARR